MSNRIEDDEVLFTTLVLMFGEPPTPPPKNTHGVPSGSLDRQLHYVHHMKDYAQQVKTFMAEMGHDPNMGLYTSFIQWVAWHWQEKCASFVKGKFTVRELYEQPPSQRL